MKIINKILDNPVLPYYSFEFFPPKTDTGVDNLYIRMDRMMELEPLFIDVTWGAGGCTRDLTLAISKYAQKFIGAEVLMHLTITNLTKTDIENILQQARDEGIMNILALRGDPPRGSTDWAPHPEGLSSALELVKFIREKHGDYFCIGVAGYPEGYPSAYSVSFEEKLLKEVKELKLKLDAGADFILTQFFYDASKFLNYLALCRENGISCPIIPGIMPFQSYSSFIKMISYCKTNVPVNILNEIEKIKDDDEKVKKYGVEVGIQLCKDLMENGVQGFHFYTLNLELSVTQILEVGFDVSNTRGMRRSLPWRASRANLKGKQEEVRPINWSHRHKSYITRTFDWDEFPNGRWGDNRSPAYGELNHLPFFHPKVEQEEDSLNLLKKNHLLNTFIVSSNDLLVASNRDTRLAMWGESLVSEEEVFDVFAKYLEGKIPIIPWCTTPLQPETSTLITRLISLNKSGYLTINSQPVVNGIPSSDSVFGWGGADGRVYQKAYLEFFTSLNRLKLLEELLVYGEPDSKENKYKHLVMYAINSEGNLKVIQGNNPNAVEVDIKTGQTNYYYSKPSDLSRLKLHQNSFNSFNSFSSLNTTSNSNSPKSNSTHLTPSTSFINNNYNIYTSSNSTSSAHLLKRVTALTWGSFPNKEIIQPTIFDVESFKVWSKESFALWIDTWACIYDDETETAELLHMIHDEYYLVAIIDNDYFDSVLMTDFLNSLISKTSYGKKLNSDDVEDELFNEDDPISF